MTVIRFPSRWRETPQVRHNAPAVIFVLPVIRIERYEDELVSEPVESRCRQTINLLRHALKGAPPALDDPRGPV